MHLTIAIVGAFPPPIHGMSAVNSAMYSLLSGVSPGVMRFDLSPKRLGRNLTTRCCRIGIVAREFIRFLGSSIRKRPDVLYMGLSGGHGQVYELLFVAAARVLSARMFLHHHSFAYLTEKKVVSSALFSLAGSAATHVVLSSGMGLFLRQRYGNSIGAVHVQTNASFLSSDPEVLFSGRDKVQTVGFLGNVSAEKGILDYLEVMEECVNRELGLEGIVAGPFENEEIASVVRARLATNPKIQYVGPVYGKDKEKFFGQIDVLLFPTHYANEAEPLVVHEALREGVPVIATARGAIEEMITCEAGVVVRDDARFVAESVRLLVAWKGEPEQFRRMSCGAYARYKEMREGGLVALKTLCGLIAGGPRGGREGSVALPDK